MPVGCPLALSVLAATRASSQVSGGLEPGLVEQVLPPDHGKEDVVDGDPVDPALDVHGRPRGRDPSAVLLADLVVDVGEVRQRLVVDPGQDRRAVEEDVVTRPRGELRGHPRRDLEVGDVVHPHLHPVLVAPLSRELVEPGVVGGDEVAPREDAQVGSPDLGGSLTGREQVGQGGTGQPDPGGPDELATGHPKLSVAIGRRGHDAPPPGCGADVGEQPTASILPNQPPGGRCARSLLLALGRNGAGPGGPGGCPPPPPKHVGLAAQYHSLRGLVKACPRAGEGPLRSGPRSRAPRRRWSRCRRDRG